MRKGELAKFLFKKEYVFKDLGCEPRVPGGTVLWEIELLGFVDHGVLEDINEMPRGDKRKASFQHLLTIASGHKEVGNDLYKRKQVSQAISIYMKAIKLLEECSLQDEKEEKEMNAILLKLYSNMMEICPI
ncbi:inactive peptidyl-prolyl cis-trans isomerase FKBP6-like [Exaiptasia diaphana]|uniref:Peptidylprolyl isomerase n=1 Tax=Exaiptasia diaphana TaxID=2652724 RepID=A0A913XV95_EXADI|nr:inactive peptidyl-prolyl cis-trans isomerase FKBP6-like [Exaiptasia diaphana]